MRSACPQYIGGKRSNSLVTALILAGLGIAEPTALFAKEWTINSCDDGPAAKGTPGTLRNAITNATSNDVIDMTELVCGKITLSNLLVIPQDYLSLAGPGADELTITIAPNTSRLMIHNGRTELLISKLTLDSGFLEVSNGQANGGCVFSESTLRIQDSVVSHCTSKSMSGFTALGGGISASKIYLTNSTISGNSAQGAGSGGAIGGGVYARGNIHVYDSTFTNNFTQTDTSTLNAGGAIYIGGGGTTVIMSSLIANNQSELGAIWVSSSLKPYLVTIANSTITGNHSSGTAGVTSYRPMQIYNSTIANNVSTGHVAAGVFAYSTLSMQSTIAANNIAQGSSPNLLDVDSDDGPITGSNNLITGASGTVPIDTISACPLLGALDDNGGPTLILAIAHNSPAIDAGSNLHNFQFDQRETGFERKFGAAPDIGAFEWQGNADDRIFAGEFENRCM